jgi:hypothetical protein
MLALAQEIQTPALWSITSLEEHVQGLLDFKIEDTRVCKGYAISKHANTTFPSNQHILRGILDLIHSNVCEPMLTTSLSGNIYYVSFIDDSSRKS